MADGGDDDLEPIDLSAPPNAWPPPAPTTTMAPPSPSGLWALPPPPPSNHRVGWIVGVGVAMVIAAVVAFTITYNLDSSSNNTTTPPATAAPNAPAPNGAAATLGRISLQQSDVPAGIVVGMITNGDQLTRPTLDLCNGTFPSEARRVARWQVASLNSQGNSALSTEAVLYRRAADGAQAFTELRNVAAACPNKPVVSPVGETTRTTRFHAPPDTEWGHTANVDRLAFDMTTTGSRGQPHRSVAVYLRRGRLLMGLYFSDPTGAQSPVAGKTKVGDIVRVFESRIASLRPATVSD